MSVQQHSVPPGDEADLDSTAELPVLEVATFENDVPERSGNTDAWYAPAHLEATQALPIPGTGFPAAAVTVDRSHQLEADLRSLSESLKDVEERLARKGERLVEIERELADARAERIAVDERAARLIAEAQAQSAAAIAEAEARSAEAIRQADERIANAVREAEERAAERVREIETRTSALVSAAEQRATEAVAELADACAQLAVERANTTNLRSVLEEHERAARDLKQRDGSLHAKLAAQERELRIARDDLRSLEARAAGYLESLQSLEGLRNVYEEQFLSADAQLGARDQEIERLTQEVAKQTAEVSRLNAELTARQQRIAELEQAAAASVQGLASRDEQIGELQARVTELERELASARAESAERASAIQRAEAERDEHATKLAAANARVQELEQHLEDHAEMVRQLREELRSALNRGTELEGDLNAAEEAIRRLETDLRAKTSKVDELTRTHEEWRSTIEDARQSLAERDSLIHRLETEARHSAALLGNIQQSIRRFDGPAGAGNHEVGTEGAVRLLIRMDGDSEVVHVLGRKTTVGRTADNDLQIDAKFISRNHAVILAGPNHTIIEDLNSTNGVAVNGKRIARHTLRDGDTVQIGKTNFRFAVRPSQERRA